MTPTDNEFYEAYKKSASFCDDLYQKEREKNYKSGIKYYIEDMEHTPFSVARMIPNWNSDLKKLKYLLYLRNQISHDINTSPGSLATSDDTLWIQSFYQRLLNQSDPLALKHQLLSPTRNTNTPAKSVSTPNQSMQHRTMPYNPLYANEADREPQNMHFHWTWIVIGIVIAFIVLFFIYLGAII